MPHTGREGAIRSGMARVAWHLGYPSEAPWPGGRAGVTGRVPHGSGASRAAFTLLYPSEKRPQRASRILYTVAD